MKKLMALFAFGFMPNLFATPSSSMSLDDIECTPPNGLRTTCGVSCNLPFSKLSDIVFTRITPDCHVQFNCTYSGPATIIYDNCPNGAGKGSTIDRDCSADISKVPRGNSYPIPAGGVCYVFDPINVKIIISDWLLLAMRAECDSNFTPIGEGVCCSPGGPPATPTPRPTSPPAPTMDQEITTP